MKTTSENKKELVNYLIRTTKHLFMKSNGTYFLTMINNDTFIIINSNNKVTKYDINKMVEYYKENSKCVMKHIMFLNNAVKTTKKSKITKNSINDFYNKFKELSPSSSEVSLNDLVAKHNLFTNVK